MTETTKQNLWMPALRQAIVAIALGFIALITIYRVWFFDFYPELVDFQNPDAVTRSYTGSQFGAVNVGGGKVVKDSVVITDFAGESAILALGVPFKAKDYPFLKFHIKGLTRFSIAYVFWRQADNPQEIHSLQLNRSGDEVTQVAMFYGGDNYKGEIVELSVGFFDGPALGFSNNNDVDIELVGMELRPLTYAAVIEQIWEDWVNPPLWQGYSNNIVRGVHGNGMVMPNLALNLLVALAAVILLIMRAMPKKIDHRSGAYARAVLVSIGICWLLGDSLRWQWRIEQLIDTHERYAGLPLEERIRNNPIRCARFPEDCKADLLPYF